MKAEKAVKILEARFWSGWRGLEVSGHWILLEPQFFSAEGPKKPLFKGGWGSTCGSDSSGEEPVPLEDSIWEVLAPINNVWKQRICDGVKGPGFENEM